MPAALGLIVAAFVVSCAVSCTSVPRYYISSARPHKDSVVLTVFLESRQDAGVYEEIARRELEKVLASQESRAIPLYEIRLEFYGSRYPHRKFAVVSTNLDEPLLEQAQAYEVPLDDYQLEVLGSGPASPTGSRPSWNIYLY